MNAEAVNVDNMEKIKPTDLAQIKQFFAAFDYEQLGFIQKILEETRNAKFKDHYQDIKEQYKKRKLQRNERELQKEQEYYPLVRRFCKERLSIGDIVKFTGSNDFREIVEITDCSAIGLQVYFRGGIPVRTGYSSENSFEKLEGMRQKGIFVPTKELIKQL
jgi:hypothetical protein